MREILKIGPEGSDVSKAAIHKIRRLIETKCPKISSCVRYDVSKRIDLKSIAAPLRLEFLVYVSLQGLQLHQSRSW